MVHHGLKICSDVSDSFLTPNEEKAEEAFAAFELDITRLSWLLFGISNLIPKHMLQFYHDNAAEAFRFSCLAIELIESPNMPQACRESIDIYKTSLATNAGILHRFFPTQISLPESQLHPLVRNAIYMLFDEPDISKELGAVIAHARRNHVCFSLQCTDSTHGQIAKNYQRCGGCKVVGYSSKECQTRAWKDPVAPHKDVCKHMRQIIDAGGKYADGYSEEDRVKFAKEMKKANISEYIQDRVIIWINIIIAKMAPVKNPPQLMKNGK